MSKALKHEAGLFLHVKEILYKDVTGSIKKFLALVIPKARKYTVLVEAQDKLGYQAATSDLLSNKVSVLLERHKQGYQEIHSSTCTLPQRKSKSSSLPSTNDRNSRMTIQQDSY